MRYCLELRFLHLVAHFSNSQLGTKKLSRSRFCADSSLLDPFLLHFTAAHCLLCCNERLAELVAISSDLTSSRVKHTWFYEEIRWFLRNCCRSCEDSRYKHTEDRKTHTSHVV
uniref:Uncharacterized protein n=1 Tax=Homalodisca liturata TaxID=320908 RepID=A0A1B6IDN4_9HEMI